jgi:hypothetical protein
MGGSCRTEVKTLGGVPVPLRSGPRGSEHCLTGRARSGEIEPASEPDDVTL